MYHVPPEPNVPLLPRLQKWCSNSHQRHAQRRRIGVTASAIVAATFAAGLSCLDMCSDGRKHSWVLVQGDVGNFGCPSTSSSNTEATLVAICLYCVPTGILYHLQHQKRYTDIFLVGGIMLGLTVGFAIGFGPREMLFRLFPGLALGALVMSFFGPDVEMKARDCAKASPVIEASSVRRSSQENRQEDVS